MPQPCPAPPETGRSRGEAAGHRLFGLRDTMPRAGIVAGALTRLDRRHHDLPDLGMDERDWARLFAGSRG